VHLSFRTYLKSLCKDDCSPSVSDKDQTSTSDFPQRNIGTRPRNVKHFMTVTGRKKHALRHVSSKSRRGYQHTSTTHRKKGSAISGIGGMVVRRSGPINSNSAAVGTGSDATIQISSSPSEASDKEEVCCMDHCDIGNPLSVESSDSIEGTLALLHAGVIAIVVSGSRSASSLFVEQVALVIEYIMESYKFENEDGDIERKNEAEKVLMKQIDKWETRFYCMAMKSGGIPKDEAKPLYRLFAKEINTHLKYIQEFIDATYNNKESKKRKAMSNLFGENLVSISQTLASITGDDDNYESRFSKFKKLWRNHIKSIEECVKARMYSKEAFNKTATKCLEQASKLGHKIDKYATEGSADLRYHKEHHKSSESKIEEEEEPFIGECSHGLGETCENCEMDDMASIGVSSVKRRRARRHIAQHGLYYKKKKNPGKGKLKRKHLIFVGSRLADEHLDNADNFSEEFVGYTKRIQEEPKSSQIVAHIALADSIINKCFEQCGQMGEEEDLTDEDALNAKVGAMVSGFTGALCNALEMASIYQPKEMVSGSIEHEELKANANRCGFDSNCPLFEEFPGARIDHAELAYTSLNDIHSFQINGVRPEGDETLKSIKKQWKDVTAPYDLWVNYPELKVSTEIPMSTYLSSSTSHQEMRRRNPEYHMLPTEVIVQTIESAEHESKNDGTFDSLNRPSLKDYQSEEVAEPASLVACLFTASGIDNKDKNTISMEIASSLVGAFESRKRGESEETQCLRGGKCCSIKGIGAKPFYDTIAQVVNHLRSSDFVSNNDFLRKKVQGHIDQSFNFVEHLITPPEGSLKGIGPMGLINDYASTGKKNAVVVDISRRADDACSEDMSCKKKQPMNICTTESCIGNKEEPKRIIYSIADLVSTSDEEDCGEDEEDFSSSESGEDYSEDKPFGFRITRERLF